MASPIYLAAFSTTWLLLSCAQVAFGGYERNCDFYRPPSPMGKCGKQLADLVDNVCKFYYGGKKRSLDDQSMADGATIHAWPDQRQHNQEDTDVFLPKERALAVLNKRGAYQGRITCECCQYQCTFHELSQYCSVTAIKRSAGVGLSSIIRQRPGSEKESEDLKDKQMIGHMLRKFGPQWLENYLQYIDV